MMMYDSTNYLVNDTIYPHTVYATDLHWDHVSIGYWKCRKTYLLRNILIAFHDTDHPLVDSYGYLYHIDQFGLATAESQGVSSCLLPLRQQRLEDLAETGSSWSEAKTLWRPDIWNDEMIHDFNGIELGDPNDLRNITRILIWLFQCNALVRMIRMGSTGTTMGWILTSRAACSRLRQGTLQGKRPLFLDGPNWPNHLKVACLGGCNLQCLTLGHPAWLMFFGR